MFSLTPSAHCIAAVKKVRAALFLVKRSIVDITPAVFLPFYCILVHPHLQYAIQATSPYFKKKNYHAERFQRLARRTVKGLHHLPYIQLLSFCSLEKRRRRAGLILAYGVLHGRNDVPQVLFFTIPLCSHLHGSVPSVHLCIYDQYFSTLT